MTTLFEELDRRSTPMGEIVLRRRREPVLDVDVHEVKLGDEYLMSSLFTVAEVALATLGLAAVADDGSGIDVAVGGLGLGYTAQVALDDRRVRSVAVVEALDAVVGWHRRGLLPFNTGVGSDRRCHLVTADFFALVRTGAALDVGRPGRCHALLVDIDHAPDRLLHPDHADLYTAGGLGRLLDHLHPGGVFALWSDDPPDPAFVTLLHEVFAAVDAHVVPFPNPYTGEASSNTVYVATAPA
jgi:spermidine synthase